MECTSKDEGRLPPITNCGKGHFRSPQAGGRRETDAAREVLLELDTSLGLRSQSWKGGPSRPWLRPQPPQPPPQQGRETTIFLEGTEAMRVACDVGEVSPLLSTLTLQGETFHVGTLQRRYKKISDAWNLVVHSVGIPPDTNGSGSKVTGQNGMGTEQATECAIILS